MLPAHGLLTASDLDEYLHGTANPLVGLRSGLVSLRLPWVRTLFVTPQTFFHLYASPGPLPQPFTSISSSSSPTRQQEILAALKTVPYPRPFLKVFRSYFDTLFRSTHQLLAPLTPGKVHQPFLPQPPQLCRGDAAVLDQLRHLWADSLAATAPYSSPGHIPDPYAAVPLIAIFGLPPATASGMLYSHAPATNTKQLARVDLNLGYGYLFTDRQTAPVSYLLSRQLSPLPDPLLASTHKQLALDHRGHWHTRPVSPKQAQTLRLTPAQQNQLIVTAKRVANYVLRPTQLSFIVSRGQIFFVHASYPPTPVPSLPSQPLVTSLTSLTPLATGVSLSPGLTSGPLYRVTQRTSPVQVPAGSIVHLPSATKSATKYLANARGVIVAKAQYADDLCLFARDLGVPLLTNIPWSKVKAADHSLVTLDAASATLYTGAPPIESHPAPLGFNHPGRTATKVFLALTPPFTAISALGEQFDGIGPLSGATLLKSYQAPASATATGVKNHLLSLLSPLAPYLSAYPLLYQLTPSLPAACASLDLSAVRAQEAAALCHLAQPPATTIICSLPPTLSPPTALELKRHLAAHHFTRSPRRQLYQTINTPAALLTLDAYTSVGVDGFLIDLDTLIPLLLGLSPEAVVYSPAFRPLLAQAVDLAARNRQRLILSGTILAVVTDYILDAVSTGVSAVAVGDNSLLLVRERLRFAETRQLQNSQHQ